MSRERDESHRSEPDDDAPQCPVRREASFIVAELGVVMIFLHEAAHHALGHLDADRRLGLTGVRREACGNPDKAEPLSPGRASVLQAEELEADAFAFRHVITLASGNEPPFATQLIRVAGLRERLFELAIAAHAILVCFFGGIGGSVGSRRGRAHPHAAVRLLANQITFADLHVDRERTAAALRDSVSIISSADDGRDMLRVMESERGVIADEITRLHHVLSTLDRERFRFTTGRRENTPE